MKKPLLIDPVDQFKLDHIKVVLVASGKQFFVLNHFIERNFRKVLFYAESMTGSMERAIRETNRRRKKQLAYNRRHKITPRSIVKSIEEVRITTSVADARRQAERRDEAGETVLLPDRLDAPGLLAALEEEMWREAEALNFERAASIRDRIEEIRLNVRRRKSGGRSR